MKRILVGAVAVLGLTLGFATHANASWSEYCYSGYQPWWNVFAKRYKCLTPEEERLQKFWHDYYDAMKNYYSALDKIDWVAYYKNHGVAVCNGGCCNPCGGGRINYYPVYVNPGFSWAMPSMPTQGPPCSPYAGPMPGGPMMGGPMPGGPMPAGAMMAPPGGFMPGGMPAGMPGGMPASYGPN